MSDLHRLTIAVSEEDFPLAEALVSQKAEEGWEEESLASGSMLLRVTFEQEKRREELAGLILTMLPRAQLSREYIPHRDWLAEWRSYFTPAEAGKFLILPPWIKDAGTEERIPIIIEPKSAFGTGHHPTTTMCLEAVSILHRAGIIKQGQSFLDVGTGTGILGIGCVKLGLKGYGVDIDPLSVGNALENSEINRTAEDFYIREGSIELFEGHSFDVVIANILAGPLCEMAPRIQALVKEGGCLILSGFLSVQVPGMLKAYESMGRPQMLKAPSPASDPTRSAGDARSDGDEWVCFFWPPFEKN